MTGNSGFPKSLDVSKAIDSAAGATREVVGPPPYKRGAAGQQYSDTRAVSWDCQPQPITAPATPEARKWSGFGTALKPAAEFWILARKPLDGTVAANVLKHGTGALNIDAARVGTAGGGTDCPHWPEPCRGHGNAGQSTSGETKHGLPPPGWPVAQGRFPANLVLSHTAWEETHCRPCGAVLSFVARFCPECGSDAVTHRRAGCCAVGERRVAIHQGQLAGTIGYNGADSGRRPAQDRYADGLETVTAWECLASCDCGRSRLAASGGAAPRCACGRGMAWACPVARLDEQSGELTSGRLGPGHVDTGASSVARGAFTGRAIDQEFGNDSGGASRFFNTFAPPDDVEPFFYCAKPSTAEAEAGCERLPVRRAHENVDREEGSAGMQSPRAGAGRTSGRRNHHPTKKSIALMRHFCRLVCPPGGIVLDMFAGSGTTIGAWQLEGGRAIGIEMDPEFVAIARARAAFWGRLAGTKAATMAKPRPVREKTTTGQGTLF